MMMSFDILYIQISEVLKEPQVIHVCVEQNFGERDEKIKYEPHLARIYHNVYHCHCNKQLMKKTSTIFM